MNGLYKDNSIDALNLYSQRIEADMSRFTGGATKKRTKKATTKVKLTGAQKDAAFARSKAQAAKDRAARAAAQYQSFLSRDIPQLAESYPIVPYVDTAKQIRKSVKKRIAAESASKSFVDSLLASFAAPKAAKRGRVAKPPRPRPPKLTAQQKAARARSARENKKLDKLIAIQEAVEMQYPNITDADRFEVEVSHKLNPRSKTTPLGRSYFGKLARQGCLSAIDYDDRYGYLCNRIAPPTRSRKRGAGLSGLGYASGLSGLGYSRASGLSAAGLSAAGGMTMAKAAQRERWADYQNEINNLRNMGHSYRQAQQMAKHILRIN